jgi:hypothetical protein
MNQHNLNNTVPLIILFEINKEIKNIKYAVIWRFFSIDTF